MEPSTTWEVNYLIHKTLPWSPPSAKPIQSTPPHPVSPRAILISSTHLRLDLHSDFFLLAFPHVTYMRSSSPHSWYIPLWSHPPWLDLSDYIWRRYKLWDSSLCSFLERHVMPLQFEYSPKHSVLKHPQTGRPLVVRLNEHIHNFKEALQGKSKLVQHGYEEGRRVIWNEVRISEIESNSGCRKYKESSHMACLTNPIIQPSLDISPIWTLLRYSNQRDNCVA
jgi:hypothetical protein